MHARHALVNLSREALLSIAVVLIVSAAWAAEPPSTGWPSGRETESWKWSVNNKTMTLRLKREGENLTGALIANDGSETPIEDGKYDDGVIAFKARNSFGKATATAEYAGVIAGTKINGGMRLYFGPRPKTLPGYAPWQATRIRSSNKPNTQSEGNK
jgi:hypothetical protein